MRRFGSDEEAGLASYDLRFRSVNGKLLMLRGAQRARLEARGLVLEVVAYPRPPQDKDGVKARIPAFAGITVSIAA